VCWRRWGDVPEPGRPRSSTSMPRAGRRSATAAVTAMSTRSGWSVRSKGFSCGVCALTHAARSSMTAAVVTAALASWGTG
jgi:hypothetical protein